jgi:enterochelin esterase-like enzyme
MTLAQLAKLILPLLFGFGLEASAQAVPQTFPQADTGKIVRLEKFASKHVDARNIDIWLPHNFEALKNKGQKFNVIYMHDGQMLFDPKITWNKQAWHIDRAVSGLMNSGQIGPTMVVGIWNNAQFRHSEYFPQKYLQHMLPLPRAELIAKGLQGRPQSDAYLKFLVEELKPYIDAHFPTAADLRRNVLMGSSMGGLISLYAMNEYPQVFGGAAGLSTHWMGTHDHNSHVPLAAFNYLRDHLATPSFHRIYQDHGTIELDAKYAPYQVLVNQIIRDKGYVETGPKPNFMTRVFEGTGHNERVWAERVEIPILFLLGE